MKIFGFFVDQSKRLMALVIVLVLLASAVGVAASEATGPEDAPDLRDELEDAPDLRDEKKKVSFTLEHYHPFEYFKPGMGHKIEPAGDLVATLKDEDGKGIPLKKVLFYVEPGTNLYGALKSPIVPDSDWIRIHRNLNVPMDAYIGYGYTINNGEAYQNYILYGCIMPYKFSKSLIKEGKVEGTIKAVVVNESTLEIEYEASIPIEFKGIAKILEISGVGWEDDAFPYMPGRAGPGEIRVTRPLAYPSFENKEVEEGFLLMPGDIITIDGGVTVDIGWINGNKAIAKVPKYQVTKTGSLPVPDLSLILNPTAYESGFHTRLEKEVIAPLFGLTVDKGVDYMLECCGVFGKSAKFVAKKVKFLNDVRKAYKKVDLSEIDLIAKIRVRSTVRVDSTGDEIHIYNIEGSPDIKTVKGEEVTLADKEMVTISENGSFSKVQSFDPEKVLNEFYDMIPSTTDVTGLTFESHSKPCGSSVQIPLTLNGIDENIGNMDITLSYDPSVLEVTEVTKGDLTTDSLFEYNILDGTIKISLADAEGFSGNGSIAYVTFNVTGAADSTSPLQIAALTANRAEDCEVLVIPTNDGVFRVESGLTISVSDTTGAKGSTVEVPINLEGASEVGSMDIFLNYDANVLSAVDVEAGALGKNALIVSNTANDGEVIIALADSSGINGDGTVAIVAFEVIGDVGTTSALTLEAVLVHNLDLAEIIPNTESGTFWVI